MSAIRVCIYLGLAIGLQGCGYVHDDVGEPPFRYLRCNTLFTDADEAKLATSSLASNLVTRGFVPATLTSPPPTSVRCFVFDGADGIQCKTDLQHRQDKHYVILVLTGQKSSSNAMQLWPAVRGAVLNAYSSSVSSLRVAER